MKSEGQGLIVFLQGWGCTGYRSFTVLARSLVLFAPSGPPLLSLCSAKYLLFTLVLGISFLRFFVQT